MTKAKSRDHFLDLLRILACFFVIVNHTAGDIFLKWVKISPTWFVSLTYFFISKVGVPIFLMITGYLLLGRLDSWKKTFQRFFRIMIALICCAFVYGVFNALYESPNLPFIRVIKDTLTFYSKLPSNALWYLYAYLGILLMMPYLQKMAHMMNKKDFHIFFLISGFFVSVLPIITHYFPAVQIFHEFELPLFSGFICMLFIGQYFSRFGIPKTKKGFCLAFLIFVFTVCFNVVGTYFEYKKLGSNYLFLDMRTHLPIVLQSACFFYMVSFIKIPEKMEGALSCVASCTFGIYLMSDITIKLLKPIWENSRGFIHPLIGVGLLELAVFFIGFIVIALLKKLPLVKKIL